MTPTIAQQIKTQILAVLLSMKQAGQISSFQEYDLGKNPLDISPPTGYPFAIVGMPQVASDYEDQGTNKRTYRFDVLFIHNLSEITSPQLEGLIDAALNAFDLAFTLSGAADAAVLPIEILTVPISTPDKQLVCFFATIRAQALFQVTP